MTLNMCPVPVQSKFALGKSCSCSPSDVGGRNKLWYKFFLVQTDGIVYLLCYDNIKTFYTLLLARKTKKGGRWAAFIFK